MKLLDVINPATEELIAQLPIDDGASVLWSKRNWTILLKQ